MPIKEGGQKSAGKSEVIFINVMGLRIEKSKRIKYVNREKLMESDLYI